jgi:hypothetical protein
MDMKKKRIIDIQGMKYRRIRDAKGRPLLHVTYPNGVTHTTRSTKARIREMRKFQEKFSLLLRWAEFGR